MTSKLIIVPCNEELVLTLHTEGYKTSAAVSQSGVYDKKSKKGFVLEISSQQKRETPIDAWLRDESTGDTNIYVYSGGDTLSSLKSKNDRSYFNKDAKSIF